MLRVGQLWQGSRCATNQTLERGHLPEELVSRLGGASEQSGVGWRVRDNAGLRADLCPHPMCKWPAMAAWPPTWTKSSSTVYPDMPTWATMTQQRLRRTLCPIWTRLSSREVTAGSPTALLPSIAARYSRMVAQGHNSAGHNRPVAAARSKLEAAVHSRSAAARNT